MSANATTSSGTSHRYTSTRAVMEPIKKEYDVPESALRGVADFDLRGYSAAPVTVYGEGSGTTYAQMPNHYYPSQASISSAPLSRKRKAADTYYNQVTTSQYTLEASPLDYSNPSGAGPNSQSSRADIPRKQSKSRSSKRRKTESKTKKSAPTEQEVTLDRPLSQIAREIGGNPPDEEAETLAIRSSQKRKKELIDLETGEEKAVKRPLNAFMLYRKVHQQIAQDYCILNNHQKVSSICGESWRIWESEDFKNHYRELANIERLNHARAFPSYRYEPGNKNNAKKDTASSPQPDTAATGRRSTKGGRVTRNRKKASKRKKLQHLSDEMVQQAIEEHQLLQATPAAPLPYWNPHTLQTYPAPSAENQYAYPNPKGNDGYPKDLSVYIDPRGLYTYPDPENPSGYPDSKDLLVCLDPKDLLVCLDHKNLYAYPDPKDHTYPDPTPSQIRCITTSGDKYSAGRISPPLVQGLYGDAAEPHMNYRNGFIDPSILTQKTSMVYDLTNCSVAIQRQWQPVSVERSPAETFNPGLDIKGSYDAYLKGDEQDWKVEQLDEASYFKDEMAHTEVYSKDV